MGLLFMAPICLAFDISASVDREMVEPGDNLVLTVTVSGQGQNLPQPSPPTADGFTFADVSSSSSFSFVNGKISASQVKSYVLIPASAGTHVIKPGSINVDGKVLQADPITVVVNQGRNSTASTGRGQVGNSTRGAVNASNGAAGGSGTGSVASRASSVSAGSSQGGGNGPGQTGSGSVNTGSGDSSYTADRTLMIECEVDRNKAYVNEQVVLTFRFYRARQLYRNPDYIPPTAKNFTLEQIGRQTSTRRVINGKTYQVEEIRYALFPLFSGVQTIDPARLTYYERVNSPATRRRSAFDDPFFDSFFNDSFMNGRFQKKELFTRPINIEVMPIPQEGRPADFSNCIGEYKVSALLEKDTVKANEPLSMKVMISGFGPPSAITEPNLNLPEGFSRYDSRETSGTGISNGRIQGQKTFEYAIIPRKEGVFTLPPVTFTYFNPTSGEYQTSSTREFRVKVLPGEQMTKIASTGPGVSAGKEVALLNEDIKFIKTGLKNIDNRSRAIYRKGWLWSTLGIEIIILILGLAWKGYRDRYLSDPAVIRRRKALRQFTEGLRDCHAAAAVNQPKEFHSVLNRLFTGLIADIFNLQQAGLTNDGINDILRESGYPHALTENVIELLDTCHLNSFAAAPSTSADMERTIREAISLAEQMVGCCNSASGSAGRSGVSDGSNSGGNANSGTVSGKSGKAFTVTGLLILISLLAMYFPNPVFCDASNRSLVYFEEGNGLYREQKYAEAVSVWSKIPGDLAIANPSVFYNLGNGWYKQGKLGKARLFYEKALRIDPDMVDARYNLNYLIQQLEDKIEVPEPNFVEALLKGWQGLFSLKSLTILTLFFLHLFLVGILGLKLSEGSGRRAFITMTVSGLLLGIVFGSTLALAAWDHDYRVEGIVISAGADILAEPNLSSKLKFSLHEGAKVTIEGVDGFWYRVSLPNGYSGWAEKMSIDRI